MLPYGVPVTLSDAAPIPVPVDRKPRRRAAAIAGVVGVGAVVGGGAWAWQFWSSQGPQPAEALPASTLAYVALDLAPSGGQKLAAYDALRKFPSLKKELKLGSQDDLRRSLVNEVTSESGCDVDFDQIEPWAGDRAALAVVPLKQPEVVAVVQIDDAGKAEAGLKKIARTCADFGFAVSGGWALLAETDAIAKAVKADAADSTLADDADYIELTESAGDPGVVTLFAAPEAGQALLDVEEPYVAYSFMASPLSWADPVSSLISFATFLAFDDHSYASASEDMPGMSPEEEALFERMDDYDDLTPAEQEQLDEEMQEFYEKDLSPEEKALNERMENYDDLSPAEREQLDDEMNAFYDEKYGSEMEAEDDYLEPELPAAFQQQLRDFSGLGGVARFDDGSLELEMVADPLIGGYAGRYDGTDARGAISALPADSAVAFGGGLAEAWGKDAITNSGGGFFGMGDNEAEVLANFKESTGLTPKDLEALGGDTIAFAARAGFEEAFESEKVKTFPVAARVTGDPESIEAALAKLRATLSPAKAKFVESRRTSDGIVVGPNAAYLEELVDPEETLGDSDRFESVLPDSDEAITATLVDFDASNWLGFVLGESPDEVKALDAAGLTVTQDGAQHRHLLRVTFD